MFDEPLTDFLEDSSEEERRRRKRKKKKKEKERRRRKKEKKRKRKERVLLMHLELLPYHPPFRKGSAKRERMRKIVKATLPRKQRLSARLLPLALHLRLDSTEKVVK